MNCSFRAKKSEGAGLNFFSGALRQTGAPPPLSNSLWRHSTVLYAAFKCKTRHMSELVHRVHPENRR